MTSITYDPNDQERPFGRRCARMSGHRHGRGGPHGEGGWGGPGRGGPGGPGGGRRRGRAARGDVRAAALLLLDEQPRNGYQLMQELEQRSGGIWRPSAGAIYPALALLEDEGLIAVGEGGGSGRVFELTDAGRTHVADQREALGSPWEAVTGGVPREALELRDLVFGVGAAAKQVVRAGDAGQIARATQLLTEVRRGLYRILADDRPADAADTDTDGDPDAGSGQA